MLGNFRTAFDEMEYSVTVLINKAVHSLRLATTRSGTEFLLVIPAMILTAIESQQRLKSLFAVLASQRRRIGNFEFRPRWPHTPIRNAGVRGSGVSGVGRTTSRTFTDGNASERFPTRMQNSSLSGIDSVAAGLSGAASSARLSGVGSKCYKYRNRTRGSSRNAFIPAQLV